MSGTKMPKTMFSYDTDDSLSMLADITPGVSTPEVEVPEFDMGNMIGGLDLKGIGSIASVLGSLWSAKEDKEYKKEMLAREDERIARDRAKQDKFDADMQKAYA